MSKIQEQLDVFQKAYHSVNAIVYDGFIVYKNYKNTRESQKIIIFGCNKLIEELKLDLVATGSSDQNGRMFFDSYVIEEKPHS